ncbi:oleate hydratase [Myroides sp. NP-2]|uniref:oleate hydratase n=1 Tax=Myroides sp. NP-2 TaxID=2759945 RepID=UPI0015F7F3B7|nr:oleate hydratase [Myroides sp. NP-2]MBB1150477.1 oleate hydratase [Myroides sp. NP-2]
MKADQKKEKPPFSVSSDRVVHQAPNSYFDYPNHQPGKSLPFADQLGSYQQYRGVPPQDFSKHKVYLIGSGIATLSAAFYFIRDGQIPPAQLVFLEQGGVDGGSLDGAGDAQGGYLVRGGREMDATYENVWDIFQHIPALELPKPYSVLDEYRLLNDGDPNYSRSRLLHHLGQVKAITSLELTKKDQRALLKLLLKRKETLDDQTIDSYFKTSFFKSNFWMLWRTMFAFQPWHSLLEFKLYLHRFIHAIDGMKDFSSLVFPKYNQYDTFVLPLKKYLEEEGVTFQHHTLVTAVEVEIEEDKKTAKKIVLEQGGIPGEIPLHPTDFVVITVGSMTEDTRYGSNTTPPNIHTDDSMESKGSNTSSPGWQLWRNLAAQSPVFGQPAKFYSSLRQSAWESATLTCKPSPLVEKLKTYTVNDPYSGKTATGGIVTITDSNWLLSFTCNRQPHFPNQPKDVLVLWLYALNMYTPGDFIPKAMPQCTGNEILAELCHHLSLSDRIGEIQANTIVRTAYMPYITAMFMPRAQGDRPDIVPEGAVNIGLVGQFVETPNDVVFTMESAARTGRQAVYQLLKLNKQVPDIAPMQYDIRHLIKAAYTLNDNKPFIGEPLLRRFLHGTYYEQLLLKRDKKNKSSDAHFRIELKRSANWFKKLVN